MNTVSDKNTEQAHTILLWMRQKRTDEYHEVTKQLNNALKGSDYEKSLQAKLDDIVMRGKRIRAGIDFLENKNTIGDMDGKTAVWVVSAIFQIT